MSWPRGSKFRTRCPGSTLLSNSISPSTPEAVVNQLNKTLNTVLADPEIIARIGGCGMRRRVISVMIPSIPSLPTKMPVRSKP